MHSLSQMAAFTLGVLNNKVTRDFLAELLSIATELVLENYIVVSGLLRCIELNVHFVYGPSCNSLDYFTPHRYIVALHICEQTALLNILLTRVLEDVSLNCALTTDQCEVVLWSFS